MTTKQYLQKELQTSGHYQLTPNDQAIISQYGLSEYVRRKLLSKKFRKWKISPELEQRIAKTLSLTIEQNKPFEAIFFQGGYKLWRLPSSPQVDWAEFFNISYLLQYLAPIAAAYPQPVTLTYYMHTLLMEAHDNLTTEEINQYVKSFQKLIDEFNKYLPKNLSIKIWKDSDIYPRNQYFTILEQASPQAQEIYDSWPAEKKADYQRMAELNIKWNGKEPWHNKSSSEKKAQIDKSAIYEIAAGNYLPKVMEAVKNDKYILLFTKTTPQFIGVGTTRNSIAKHWVGFGVLEHVNNKYYPRVLSPSQLDQIKTLKYSLDQVDLINLAYFKTIMIFDQRFNFVRK